MSGTKNQTARGQRKKVKEHKKSRGKKKEGRKEDLDGKATKQRNIMGKSDAEGRTLLLQIQNSVDVEQAVRNLKGEEPLGDIKCLQL